MNLVVVLVVLASLASGVAIGLVLSREPKQDSQTTDEPKRATWRQPPITAWVFAYRMDKSDE